MLTSLTVGIILQSNHDVVHLKLKRCYMQVYLNLKKKHDCGGDDDVNGNRANVTEL